MTHPTIIYRIHIAIAEWKGNWPVNKKPQAIYLGVEEWLQFEAYVRRLRVCFLGFNDPSAHGTSFGGIPVLRVNQRRHLNVG
jgi:hypothetical protein